MFNMFGGGGSNAFKNKVKVINNNTALTDTEKMTAINLLLNPLPIIPIGAVIFSDTGEYAKFTDGSYAIAI